jgi:molecular chaperone HscB
MEDGLSLGGTDFALFGLPERFMIDLAQLDAKWKSLQGAAHPDRFATETAAAQRVAMQWAIRVNEAYRRLRDPLARAAYLCSLHGVDIEEVVASRNATLESLQGQIDGAATVDWRAVAGTVRGLMFVDKFISDIDRRVDAIS